MRRYISHSQQQTFKRCRLKHYFAYQEKLKSKIPPKQLFLGSAIHAGLAEYYRQLKAHQVNPQQYEEPTVVHLIDGFHRDIAEQRVFLDNYFEMDEEKRAEYTAVVELGDGMLTNYPDFARANDNFKVLEVEFAFEVRIPTPRGTSSQTFVRGRVDGIVEDDRGIWILEHKSAVGFDTKGLELDEQMQTYAWAIERVLGVKVQGVIYNVLRKSVPKEPHVNKDGTLSKAKCDTTPAIFRARLQELGLSEDNYVDLLAGLEYNEFYQRTAVYHNQQELANAAIALYFESQDMHKPYIYRNWTKDCNWDCVFRELCIQNYDGSDVSYLKEANFTKRKDPTEPLREEVEDV